MRRTLKAAAKKGLEWGLRPFGYRLVQPAGQFGIDAVVDVARLSRAWAIDVALVLDVGANVGASSLAFRAAWPACEVVAFEPNGAVARQLRDNVAAVGGVSVEETALGARSGRVAFHVHEDETVLSSLHATTPFTERFGRHGKAVTVAMTTLDAFCEARSIRRINLLKIDAEGSDHDVLLGARRMLAERRIDFVYCEFNSLDPRSGQLGSLLPIATLLGENAFNFIASYADYIVTEERFFAVSNALFAADRNRS